MTTLNFYSSAALKKNINARSLIMRVRIIQPQCYAPVAVLRVGYAEVIFIQTGGKLDTMWRDAWQRLASSYPTSRWDVAVTNGHCSSTVLPLTRPETQTCSVTTFSSLSQTFYLRIAWIWTRLTCHLGCSSADGLPSSKFPLSWQNEEWLSKHGRNYRMAQSLPIHHFLSPFYVRLMLFARWRHYFPRLIQKNKAWCS